jgi:hypothetical protein
MRKNNTSLNMCILILIIARLVFMEALLKGSWVKEQKTYMEQCPELTLRIIVIIKT